MKIEKGKKYRYLKHDLERTEDGWTIGKIYSCVKKNKIKDNDGDIRDVIGYDYDTFELVEEPSTEDLLKRIEALEKRLDQESTCTITKIDEDGNREVVSKTSRPCETVSKFKRIADHAQAITNEIASPKN